MTKKDVLAREQFIKRIEDECSFTYVSNRRNARYLAELILRHGVTYARLQEANCNGVGTYCNEDPKQFAIRQERFEKQLERKESQIEKRVAAICRELGEGFEPVFSGDPRGNTIKLKVPSGYTNDWAHEGVSVPTS